MNKHAAQSAFLNLRVFIALLLTMTGVFLALAGLGAFSAQAQQQKDDIGAKYIGAKSINPLVPPGFDCSKIHELGIDKQENMRAGAIMISCGEAQGGAPSPTGDFSQFIQKLLPSPLAYGGLDVDLINGPETFPHITQSETFSWANPDNPNHIVVGYNDSRCRTFSPINISGASVSTDGGVTFDRLTRANGCSPFDNTYGDPVVFYNRPTSTWFAIFLDGGCGGQGIGGYKSTTPWDPNSWTHFCAHNGGSDDRESGWVDNNPSSPFANRMYVSWNDFAAGQGIFVTYSSDNGTTWHSPINVVPTFIRNIQITGDKVTGDVYIAGMDEMGGGLTNRANKIYRSTDGGDTWTNTYTGPTFPGPGRSGGGYFAAMYANPSYWRHMGWGQPAAFNHVVSYVYAARNTGNGDPGDVFYIRSTDMGVTFSAPFQLNSNTDHTKAQWEPNLSVSEAGWLFATWYDETPRVAVSCQPSSPSTPCYQIHSRKSNDNGVTWLPDETFSDVPSPLPLQPDPGIVGTYAGDYDYGSAIVTKHLSSWVDGRVPINGASQQDAFTDRELVGFSVLTTVPACNSLITTQPVDFAVNLSDAVNTGTVEATDFTVDGTPSNLPPTFSNGNATITFHYTTTPVTAPGPHTMHISAGAFTRQSDGMPVLEFLCTLCYDTAQLMVTSTSPPVGGTFSPPAPGSYDYLVNLNLAVDPTSVQDSDLTFTGNAGGRVVSHTLENGNTRIHFIVEFDFGGAATANISAGAITSHTCNFNTAFSGNYTVQGCPPPEHYVIAQVGGSIVPGTTDSGNHGDDVVTAIPLPFAYTLYDTNYTSVNVSSNGNAQFTTTDTTFTNQCLPWLAHNHTIYPYWDDLRTDMLNGCSSYPGGVCGIYTSISGTAPNRIFNIEWRAVYFNTPSPPANFELRLYEGQSRFDVVYGTVSLGNTGATAGTQKNNTLFDQYFCNGVGGAATGGQSYTLTPCASPTPTPTAAASPTTTPTATATASATATATVTPTATSTPTPTATPRPSPTPRFSPAPRIRPTAPPRP